MQLLPPAKMAAVRAPMSAAFTIPSQFASPRTSCAGLGHAASSTASATTAAAGPRQRRACAPEPVRPPPFRLRM